MCLWRHILNKPDCFDSPGRLFWQRQEDSNHHQRFWRPPLYLLSYTLMKRAPPEKTPRRSPKTYASITWCRNILSGRRAQTNQFDWTDPLFCLLGYDQNQRRLCGVQIHICATFKAGFYLSIAVPVESYNRGQRINGDGAGGRTRTGDTAPGLQHSTN